MGHLQTLTKNLRTPTVHLPASVKYLRTLAGYLQTSTKPLQTPTEYLRTPPECLQTSTEHLSTSTKHLQTSEENLRTSAGHLRILAQNQPRLSGNQLLFPLNFNNTKPSRFLSFFFVHKPWRFLMTVSLNIKSLMTNHSPFITRLRRSHMGVNSFLLFCRWSNYSPFLLKKDLHLCRYRVQPRNFLFVLLNCIINLQRTV